MAKHKYNSYDLSFAKWVSEQMHLRHLVYRFFTQKYEYTPSGSYNPVVYDIEQLHDYWFENFKK